jgi:glycosyltransferase involved in cell wall biosynthesis
MQIERNLRIAIECRIPSFQQGVGTAILSLAKALSDTKINDQKYTFIVHEEMRDWLAPYVYGPCSLVSIAPSRFSVLKKHLRPIGPLRYLKRKLSSKSVTIPVSDGYVESQKFDLVHFPTQAAYLTELPSIYQPHDLQHLHYPEFFTKSEFAAREKLYRFFCDRASFVCVHTQWTKRDLIKQYGITPEKIAVIPWGSVFQAYKTPSIDAVDATARKYGFKDRFFFYPAATWPHKNHEVIFHALHYLKSNFGIVIDVYFTGATIKPRPDLNRLARDLGISQQVHFVGFMTAEELQSVFLKATAMIYASKFEGFGLPILEAFYARLPVISSNASTLPEVAQDAVLYFDPDSPAELATLMKKILDAPEIRQELIEKGTQVLSQYSFKDAAANFQTLYERTIELTIRGGHVMTADTDSQIGKR